MNSAGVAFERCASKNLIVVVNHLMLFVAAGPSHAHSGFCTTSFRRTSLSIATCFILLMLVAHIFLFGTFIILSNDTASLGFIIYLI